LSEFDIFVLSSVTEGFSIATIEAMGLGLPVVVTDSGGPREIVQHLSTGMLVSPGDPKALAAAIDELLEDAELAKNLGAAARASVREKFGIEQNLVAYTELYKSCLR
jgi:glycosyltransferase involved in cell wall biosynthesis